MMLQTPASYLADRRREAGFSLEDVAVRIGTEPGLVAWRRAEFVGAIEAGLIPVRLSTGLALAEIPELRIDLFELGRLIDAAEGVGLRLCRAPNLGECR